MPERASPFAPSSWIDRCFAARDRLLASPRFQRWAAGFPLTRQIAQKRAQALFDLCAGFVYSQVLAACVKLKLFDILAEQPQTAAQLSRRLALPLDRTMRLLAAAVSLRLGGAPLARALRTRRARRCLAGQSGDRRDGRASCAALCGSARSGRAAARRAVPTPRCRHIGRMRATSQPSRWHRRRSRPTARSCRVAIDDRRRCARCVSASRAPPAARCRRRRGRVRDRGSLQSATPALRAVRSAAGRRARPRADSPTRRLPRDRRWRVGISSTTHCRKAPTSSRWCASCTTTTTLRSSRCFATFAACCRRTACCSSPSRCRGRPAPKRSRTPISASTCWRWAAAERERPDEIRRLLQTAGFESGRLLRPAAPCW